MRITFAIVLALVVGTLPSLAQHTPSTSTWSTTVQLIVQSQDPAAQNDVFSWFTEELRRMQGVELVDPARPVWLMQGRNVVDSAPEWQIRILVHAIHQAEMESGYALSEMVLSRYDDRPFFQVMAIVDPDTAHHSAWAEAARLSHPAWDVADHNLVILPLGGLRRATEDLAARFRATTGTVSATLGGEEPVAEEALGSGAGYNQSADSTSTTCSEP